MTWPMCRPSTNTTNGTRPTGTGTGTGTSLMGATVTARVGLAQEYRKKKCGTQRGRIAGRREWTSLAGRRISL